MQNELQQEGGAFFFNQTTDIYPIVEPSDEVKEQASVDGQQLLDAWLSHKANNGIDKVLKKFNPQGKPYKINATAFSDYYKWTMMPVIWHLHKFITAKTSKNTFKVTFGIDIRDKTMRDAINTDPVLRNEIKKALDDLSKRLFDRGIFEKMNNDNDFLNGIIPKECIDYICVGRTLAKSVTMSNTGKITYPDDDEVHIGFFIDSSAKYNPSDAEAGLWFIEARGPWPRVTWLETSLMQAVYEAYLRYNLKKLAKAQNIAEEVAYQRWLYGALLRCAKSVAYTRLVQKMEGKLMTPALFTGRRTGGYLFLLLQNLFFAHHFNQFTAPPPPKGQDSVEMYTKKIAEWKEKNYTDGKTSCLGTSSVDSYYELTSLELSCLKPVGTHAHELSMVISILFPYFDKNKFFLPLTQIIGHYLYRQLSAAPRPTTAGVVLFPMLPDTLGTAAFMKAANWVKFDGESFIKKINSARQDSGKLENFLTLMNNWDYIGGKMASEIDDTETLLKATNLGYTTSGAGGFFGDSVKVWNPEKQYHPPSMAVKAVKVEYCVPEGEEQLYSELYFPHINITYNRDGTYHVKGFPIKVGDPENMENAALAEGKLSLDKTLPADLIEAIKCWVSYRRVRAFKHDDDEIIRAANLPINTFIGADNIPITTNLAAIRG